jgi:Disaggregatase related
MIEEYLRYVQQNLKTIVLSIFVTFFLIALALFLFQIIVDASSSHEPLNKTVDAQDNVKQTKQSNSSYISSNTTVSVAGDGSGDFNCEGNDTQIEINKALAYVAEHPQLNTVYLKGPNTYVISDTIFIGNNTTLEGDTTAVIKLKDKADWPIFKPLMTQMNSTEIKVITANGFEDRPEIHGVTIKGFEINGNHDNNTDRKKGLGYYNIIYFTNAKDIQVHDMYIHDGTGEAVRIEGGSDIGFYKNTVYKVGHNDLFAEECQNVEAWSNRLTVRTDSGLKVTNSNHVKFHDNFIDSFYCWSAGNAGILIEKTTGVVNDVEIYNNIIQDTYGPGILLSGSGKAYPKDEAKNIHIFHNILRNTGTNPNLDWVGGIVASGFYNTLIENNTIDGAYHSGIIHMYPTGAEIHRHPSDIGYKYVDLSPKGTGYSTIVRNNIIANTKQRKKDPEGTGYGVINYLADISSIDLEHNCLFNNSAGNYLNCTSTTDIYVDPILVNKSIGAGYSNT